MEIRDPVKAFDDHSQEYDDWFAENTAVYGQELAAVKSMIPLGLNGVEIGVGTGRFAAPLRIATGVEPSKRMAEIARERGIKVYRGKAERLPFGNETFGFVLMVTAICFFEDVPQAFREAYRVVKSGGILVIAMIDSSSALGRTYRKKQKSNVFYKDAIFYSVPQVTEWLCEAGFEPPSFCQAVFENGAWKIKPGYGQGGFVVLKVRKP